MAVYLLIEIRNRDQPEECVGTIRAFSDKATAEGAVLPDAEDAIYIVREVELE